MTRNIYPTQDGKQCSQITFRPFLALHCFLQGSIYNTFTLCIMTFIFHIAELIYNTRFDAPSHDRMVRVHLQNRLEINNFELSLDTPLKISQSLRAIKTIYLIEEFISKPSFTSVFLKNGKFCNSRNFSITCNLHLLEI